MQLEIFWTSPAKSELRLIKRYYREKAGITITEKIFNNIKIAPEILRTHPNAGREEEMLKSLNEGHRYLVTGNYKIIYKVLDNTVFITHVFDTRQNPKKLLKQKK